MMTPSKYHQLINVLRRLNEPKRLDRWRCTRHKFRLTKALFDDHGEFTYEKRRA